MTFTLFILFKTLLRKKERLKKLQTLLICMPVIRCEEQKVVKFAEILGAEL
jgi:hypothetical protein